MRVYAYHEDIQVFNHEHLIRLWEHTWSRFGWRPVLLGYEHFRAHPLSKELDCAVTRFPSLNYFYYERACFRRWLAMATVGGGLMTDYDVMCNGFTCDSVPKTGKPVSVLGGNTPCAVYGDESGYIAAAETIISYQPSEADVFRDRPHVSDQSMLFLGAIPFTRMELVKEFGEDKWESARLIHFSNERIPDRSKKADFVKLHLLQLGLWG
jgi:hypothetical protein